MFPVTVVIATRNRCQQLVRLLDRHTAPVIVVDNGSQDGTAEMVESRFPHVRVIRLRENAGAAARNIGVAAAETPYVAFADDDSYWESDALASAARLLAAHPRAALLTGRVLAGEDGRLDAVSRQMAAAPLGVPRDLPGPSVLGFLACAAVVRRDAFLAVGGFEPKLHMYGEEALLAMDLASAGWGLAYVPSLVVRHFPESTGRDPGARRRREARNALLTAWTRRPLSVGARAALRSLASRDSRGGLLDALTELPWVRRHRRPVAARVEAALRALACAPPPHLAPAPDVSLAVSER
ncbi:glycosyltransferase family 2 protein [Krasilnikovia cinnamomea]|uniref:glycosyltransferase family 2 protein n=1 Tax=Krasilnikovia cinnamomea TaxID=349313 RepID=UPI001F5F6BD9|nr:glycosyltransferase [Krasilnikovia cinnamomea]